MAKPHLYKRLYHLFRPYFGFNTKLKRTHTFWASMLILGNVGQAVLAALITFGINGLMDAFVMEGLTVAIFLPVLGQAVGLILASAILGLGMYYSFNKLVSSLGTTLDEAIRNHWLSDNKAYHGYKFFLSEAEKKVLDVSEVVVSLPMECTGTMVELFHQFISSGLLFIVGITSLWMISVPLVLPIFSASITIPGFMVLGSLGYALAFSKIVSHFSSTMKKTYKKEIKLTAELKNNVNHLNQNSENVAFKEGTQAEQARFKVLFKARDAVRWVRISLESKLAFLRTLHDPFSILVVSIITLPSIIAKHISGTHILGILNHFESIVKFVGWSQENMEDIQSLDIKAKNIEKFLKKCKAWDEALKKNNFKRLNTPGEFGVENLTLKTPNGDLIIQNLTLNFESNTITLLSGPSGVGKSTLFRAILGILPFGEGALKMDEGKKICILSQQGYIPRDVSLLSVILYPQTSDAIQNIDEKNTLKAKVVDLLRRFQFKEETIENLEKPLNWSEVLSGGEKQRIAYISAIMAKPEILLMDEPAAALDKKMRKIADEIVKKELPDTTMVIIDHNPLAVLPAYSTPSKTYLQKIAVDNNRTFIDTPVSPSTRISPR